MLSDSVGHGAPNRKELPMEILERSKPSPGNFNLMGSNNVDISYWVL